MHELAIVQGIVDIIERERKARGFARVKSVEVRCGHYSCVTEESLRFCFEAVAIEPHLKGAALNLVRMPARFKCENCAEEFDAAEEEPGKERGQSRRGYLPPTLTLPLKGGGVQWQEPSESIPLPGKCPSCGAEGAAPLIRTELFVRSLEVD